MGMLLRFWLVLAVFCLPNALGRFPQEPSHVDDSVVEAESKSKALRLHQALQRRPAPGFLLDRFIDAWLEFSSTEDLEQFLRQQADSKNTPNDHTLLAFFYVKQNDHVRALSHFQLALAQNSNLPVVWYEKALVEARALDFDSALQDLSTAAQVNAADARPDPDLGLKIAKQQAAIHLRCNDLTAAQEVWEKLLSASPNNQLLLEDIIEQQVGEGLFRQAAEYSDRLLQITTDPYAMVVRQMRKADILQKGGDLNTALDVYSQTLPQVGRDTWLERELIARVEEVFQREDDLVGMKDFLDQRIVAEPDRLALQKALAATLEKVGQTDEALALRQRFVQLTPGDRGNREDLITALANANQWADAVAQQLSLIGQFPTDPELSFKLAEFHKKSGQEDEARRVFRDYLAKAQHTEAAYLRVARTFIAFEWAEDTKQLFEECLQRFDSSALTRDTYANWLYQHDQKPLAIELWKKSADVADKAALLQIARVLGQHGEHEVAFEILHRRFDSLRQDSVYLSSLIDLSIKRRQYSETIPWLLQLAGLCRTDLELESLIAQAILVHGSLENPQPLIDGLRTKALESNLETHGGLPSVAAACVWSAIIQARGDLTAADEILAQFENRLATAPDKTKALELLMSQRVRLLMLRQDWSGAATAARLLAESTSGSPNVNFRRLVELYLRNEQPEEALAWVERWKRRSPGQELPWLTEAAVLSRLNRDDDAFRVLRQAVRRFPQNVELATLLATKLEAAREYREAERIYWRLFEQTADVAERLRWLEQLGRIKHVRGELNELIEIFRERQKSNPESIEPMLALATLFRQGNRPEDRRQVLLEASRKQPNNQIILLETARLEHALGQWREALTTLERILPQDRSGQVAQQMAAICFEFGEYARGIQMLRLQFSNPNIGPRAAEVSVGLLLKANQWETARELLVPQMERWPDDWRLAYMLGVMEVNLGNHDVAEKVFLKLLAADNDLPGLSSLPGFSVSDPAHTSANLPQDIRFSKWATLCFRVAHEHRYWSLQPMTSWADHEFAHSLPKDRTTVRYLALGHLLMTQTPTPSSNEQLPLIRKMDECGFPHSEMLVDLVLYSFSTELRIYNSRDSAAVQLSRNLDQLQGRQKLLDKYQSEPMFWRIVLLGESNLNVKVSDYLSAYRVLREDYPDFALQAALRTSADLATISTEIVEHLPALLERINPATETAVGLAQQLADRLSRNPLADSLQVQALRQPIIDFRMRVYQAAPNRQNSWATMYLQSVILKSLVTEESVTEFVSFLENEIQGVDSNPANFAIGYHRQAWINQIQRRGYLLRPLEFPPTEHLSHPDFISALPVLLRRQESINDPHQELNEQQISVLREAAKQTQSLFLRAMLLVSIGRSAELNGDANSEAVYQALSATLEELLIAEPHHRDAMVLAASLAAHQRRWDDAAQFLERLSANARTATERKRIHAATVAAIWHCQLSNVGPNDAPRLFEAGRKSVHWLQRYALNDTEQFELLQAMESLGMQRAAQQLEQRMASRSIVQNRGTTSSPRLPQSVEQRIFELTLLGKTDAAFRLLERELVVVASQRLQKFGPEYQDNDLVKFSSFLQQLNMTTEFLEYLAQRPTVGADLLGFAQELLQEPVLAIQTYELFLETNSDREAVRLRCLLLKLNTGADEIEQTLHLFKRQSLPDVGKAILSNVVGQSMTYDRRLKIISALMDRIETVNDDEPMDVKWLLAAMPILTEPAWLDTSEPLRLPKNPLLPKEWQSLPLVRFCEEVYYLAITKQHRLLPLYAPRPYSKSAAVTAEMPQLAVEDGNSTLNTIRLRLHDRIVEVLLNHSESSSEAFSHWLTIREAMGNLDANQAATLAERILLSIAPTSDGLIPLANDGNWNVQRFANTWSRENNHFAPLPKSPSIALQSPQVYLATQLGQTPSDSNRQQIIAVAEHLERVGHKALCNELRWRYELHAVDKSLFLERVRQLIHEHSESDSNQAESIVALAGQVADVRKLDVDMVPIIQDRIQAIFAQNLAKLPEYLSGYVVPYLNERSKKTTPATAWATFQSITATITAAASQHAASTGQTSSWGEPASDPANTSASSATDLTNVAANIKTILNSFSGLSNTPEYILPFVADQDSRDVLTENIASHAATGLVAAFIAKQPPARIWEILEQSPMLQSVDRFRPYGTVDGNSSLLGQLLFQLQNQSADQLKRHRAWLAVRRREPSTFPIRLLITAIEAKSPSGLTRLDVLKALEPDLPVLQSMSPESLAKLADFVHEVSFGKRQNEMVFYDDSIKKVDSLLREHSAANRSVAQWLGREPVRDRDLLVPHIAQKHAFKDLPELIEHRPGDFTEALVGLMRRTRKAAWGGNAFDDAQQVPEIVSRIANWKPLMGLAALLHIVDHAESPILDLTSIYRTRLRTLVADSLLPDSHSIRAEELWEDAATRLQSLARDADCSSLHTLFVSILRETKPETKIVPQVATWAHGARHGSEYAAVAQQWWIAGQLILLERDAELSSTVEIQEVKNLLMALVNDQERAVSVRLVAAISILESGLALEQSEMLNCLTLVTDHLNRQPSALTGSSWLPALIGKLARLEDADLLQTTAGPFARALENGFANLRRGYYRPDLMVSSFQLLQRMGRAPGIAMIVNRLEESAVYPEIIAELTRLGYARLAWTRLNGRWLQMGAQAYPASWSLGTFPAHRFDTRFDQELESKLPELLAMSSNPGTQLLTRMYVEQFSDVEDPSRRPQVEWKARMAAIAEQYERVSFSSPEEKKLLLLLLARANQFTPQVVADIHSGAEQAGPTQTWSSNAWRNAELVAFRIFLDLQRGQTSGLNRFVNPLFRQEHVTSQIAELLASRIEQIGFESLVMALPDLLRLSCLVDSSNRGNLLASNLRLWFYLNNRSDEFDDRVASFLADHSIPYYWRTIAWITNDPLWVIAVRMRPGIRDAGLAERLELVQRMWRFQTSGEPMRAARLGLAAVVQAKLLSDEELLTVGQTLAGIDSADGEIWRQLGNRQIAAGRWLDAAASFRRAVACSSTLAARSNRQVEHAWTLVLAGDSESAGELMTKINVARLTVANQDRFARLRMEVKR